MSDTMLEQYAILCDRALNGDGLTAMERARGGYYRTRSIRSGSLLEVEAYPILPKWTAAAVKKIRATPEAIRAHNARQAEKRITRLIEANFGEGDYFFTGTIAGDELPGLKEAQKITQRFIRRVNYERRKRGLGNAKYVYAIEGWEEGSRKKRLHMHMIVDGGLDRLTLKRLWDAGVSKAEELDPKGFGGLKGLAKYLSKDPRGRKRWGYSLGLKQPVETVADRKISDKAAWRIAESPAGAAAALEKLYPGYEHVETEVKGNPYVPGAYIYAVLRRRETGGVTRWRSNMEQDISGHSARNGRAMGRGSF